MNKFFTLNFLCLLVSCITSLSLTAKPEYENQQSREVIEAMVDAHGGMQRWLDAPSIQFDNVMHNNFHGKNEFAWWVAHESIDQKSNQVWQHWPMDDANIGFDGETVWSENWKRANPTAFMVHFFYYFVNLPWITQQDGVMLSAPTRFKWPGQELDYYEIKMTFTEAPSIGKSGKDYFVLYIDPESYLLRGYQYANGFGPLLDIMNMPPGKEVFGPLWRTITRYEEVDGLTFPSAFRTSPEPDARVVGNHVILNIDISQPFAYSKSAKPDNAEIYSGPMTTE